MCTVFNDLAKGFHFFLTVTVSVFADILPFFFSRFFFFLVQVTKHMEGELYVLSSTLWAAYSKIEQIFQPHLGDSVSLAAIRKAMHDDHFSRRVTLQQSIANKLHVLCSFLDRR